MHAKTKHKHLALSLEKQTKDYQLIQRCTRYLALVWWKPGRGDPISRVVGTELRVVGTELRVVGTELMLPIVESDI